MAAIPGNPVDWSGTIASGGVSQEAMPENYGRQYLFIQNISSGDLWINFHDNEAEPDQPSIKIVPDAAISWESGFGFVPTSEVHLYGAHTGQAFVIKEF